MLFPLQSFTERLALHKWHDVVEEALGLARIEQGQDVGMVEPGGDLDLAKEALGPSAASSGRRTLTATFRSCLRSSARYGCHAAATEFPLDGVAVGEGGLQAFERVGHSAATPADTTTKMERSGSGVQLAEGSLYDRLGVRSYKQ